MVKHWIVTQSKEEYETIFVNLGTNTYSNVVCNQPTIF